MRYIAAYLLLQIGGNVSPSADDIQKLLDVVGIECEEERAEKVVSELGGKDINTLIAEGAAKLASVPSGGGGGVAAASAGAGGGGAAAAPAEAAEEKEEKKEEKEESDDDMGFGLFD